MYIYIYILAHEINFQKLVVLGYLIVFSVFFAYIICDKATSRFVNKSTPIAAIATCQFKPSYFNADLNEPILRIQLRLQPLSTLR